MQNYKQYAELETPSYGGANTALQFSLIPKSQSPRMQNAYMDEDGDISKRPGTIPVTVAALAANIEYLTIYKDTADSSATEEIYASSGTTLYKYDGTDTLDSLTMTDALHQADINTVGFAVLTSALLIADEAALKQCDGTAVTLVTPAADDPGPAPANDLAAVNTLGIKFIWSYKDQVFLASGNNEYDYTKRFAFDYVPSTQHIILSEGNDYINGNGIGFDSVCLIPMRKRWNILTGSTFDDFDSSTYLNTEHGVIAPKSIKKVTYPDGTQTIVFLSDSEMHEVYTALLDGGGRQYATRSLMQGKINFSALGLTEAEKAAAVGVFHPDKFFYLLSFQKSSVDYTYVYDTRNREWYTDWLTFNAKAYASLNGTLYFAGTAKHLQKFDVDLYSDWNESTQTTKTFVYFKRYSPALAFEFSGFPSMWDAYLVEMKQWLVTSSLDITIIFSDIIDIMPSAILNEVFVEGVSRWGSARYANSAYTDFVQEPNEILFDFSRLSKYVQVLWENDRDEPVKIFKDKWKGRISGK